MVEQTVSREALRRAAGRIGTLSDGTPAGRYLDRLLSEVEAETATRRLEVDAEVRRRWQESSDEIEDEVSGYAEGSYLDWVEDADRDYDDEEQTPGRRRSRYATLREWAEGEKLDSDIEGTGYYPSYAADITEHAREWAERLLVRDDDAEELREALEKSISDREWEWPRVETAAIVTA